MKRTVHHGFTIVELLIVIVVIGILATITIVAFQGIQNQATNAGLKSELKNAATKFELTYGTTGAYPADDSSLTKRSDVTYDYVRATDSTYCITMTMSSGLQMYMTQNRVIQDGACPASAIPAGYEVAPVASGRSTTIGGYNAVQPQSCPTTGGLWVKVPGNSLYGLPNGFCVQQYAAANVSGVATSQASTARWVSVTQPDSVNSAATAATGAHLLTEYEWMTIAANASQQVANWSGGSIGSGTLPIGSSAASYGGVAIALSNGETVYFDTGNTSGRASNEWTCYTGTNASSCGLAGQYQPAPANAYFTDQFGILTSYGSMQTSGGYYYGDPRFANPGLASYVTSARNKGLGYLRSSYASGATTVYGLVRGNWIGATSSGLFTMYMYTQQSSYSHGVYGFRAAK